MKVPLLDLPAQYARIREEIDAALRRVVESQVFVLGPEVEAFEREVSDALCGVHAVGCGSGSDALVLALLALGVGPGDQVIVPALTFYATAGSVALLGAEPVFVDLEPESYALCPRAAREAAARCPRLRAIVPVHLYGRTADLDALLALAREHGVALVEDAAQALGARDASGAPVPTRGTLGCVSFFPSKNAGAYGEAGLLTTADPELAARLRQLRVHGENERYHHARVGINARLDAIQAAVLRVKLRHLDDWNAARARNAARYDAAFAAAGAAPSGVPWSQGGLPLRTPRPPAPPARHVYHQYVVRVPAARRDPLRARLADAGVATGVYYPVPLHLQACFRPATGAPPALPESEAAAREVLSLPVHPELESGQIDYVAEQVLVALG